jgi:hypothetical protein
MRGGRDFHHLVCTKVLDSRPCGQRTRMRWTGPPATARGGTAAPSVRDLADAHLIKTLGDVQPAPGKPTECAAATPSCGWGSCGVDVAHKTMWRPMRLAGPQGVHRRRWRHHQPSASMQIELLDRQLWSTPKPDWLEYWYSGKQESPVDSLPARQRR